MSPNEFPGVQSRDQELSDVETQLRTLKLRRPSDQLDASITSLFETANAGQLRAGSGNQQVFSRGHQFGWTAIFATAAAAMFAGLWLGHYYSPAGDKRHEFNLAVADSSSADATAIQLTPVSFNVDAFNLLHGHSQREEFENCDQCHQQQAESEDELFAEIFEDWFYGDEDFFEAHLGGLGGCAKCHVFEAENQRDIGKDAGHGFGKIDKLANCSDCHKVDAEGFSGFKKDWHSSSSEG